MLLLRIKSFRKILRYTDDCCIVVSDFRSGEVFCLSKQANATPILVDTIDLRGLNDFCMLSEGLMLRFWPYSVLLLTVVCLLTGAGRLDIMAHQSSAIVMATSLLIIALCSGMVPRDTKPEAQNAGCPKCHGPDIPTAGEFDYYVLQK